MPDRPRIKLSDQRRHTRDRIVPAALAASIAATQDGCVTRSQLIAGGLTEDQVRTLQDQRVMTNALGAVYVVGHQVLSHRQFMRCTLLATDDPLSTARRSGLSHRTGCEHRALLATTPDLVEVTTDRRGIAPTQQTLLPLESTGLPGHIHVAKVTRRLAGDCGLEVLDGLAVLPLPRTLIDLAERHGKWDALRAWREADYLRLLDEQDIAEVFGYGRRRGVRTVRKIWEREGIVNEGAVDLRSRGEMRFLRLVRRAGLPEPLTNQLIEFDGRLMRPDFYFVDAGVAVEIDGGGHLRKFAEEADDARDTAMHAVDVDILRFTTADLRARSMWALSLTEEAIARNLAKRAAA